MKNRILTGLLLLLNLIATAQIKINQGALREDYKTFIQYLEETHPDPYTAFGGKLEFNRQAQNLSTQISDTTTLAQFIDLLNGFASILEDGHTSINRLTSNEELSTNKALPLKFKIATDGIFVENTTREFSYLIGSKLIAVDNNPIDSFAKEASKLLPAENIYGRYRFSVFFLSREKYAKKLIHHFPSVNFEFILPNRKKRKIDFEYQEAPIIWNIKESSLKLHNKNDLLYSQNIGDTSAVKYFAWNAVFSKEIIPFIKNSNTLNYILNQTYKNSTRPKNDSIAIEGVPELYSEFSRLLKEMKQQDSNYLIIDLRFNSGGYTNLSKPLLYMLFGDNYLNYKSKSQYNRKLSKLLLKKHKAQTVSQLLNNDQTKYQLGDIELGSFFKFNKNSTIEEKRKDSSLISYFGKGYNYTEKLNGNPIYEPKIIAITSPTTFSAAYHFLYLLDEIGDTTIIGVPSGQAGNTFMESTPFQLPNTKLKGSISNTVQLFYPNNQKKGKVLLPDFPMNISDFAKYNFDQNAEVLYTLDLIYNGKIK